MSLTSSELIAFLQTQNLIVYNTLAATTFTFWNHCTTFHEEVDLIWRSKWGLVNVVYCVIRYVTLLIRVVETIVYTDVYGILRPSSDICIGWVWFETATGLIVYIAVELLLVLRVFAFYGRSMRLLAVLITLFILERVSTLIIAIIAVPKFDVSPSTLPTNLHVGRCIVTHTNGLFFSFWMPGFIVQTFLFLLLIAMFFQTKIYTDMSSPRLLVVFVRDGAWAFILMFAILLWAALGFELGGHQGDIAITWLHSALDFCGSRLILNLRAVAREQVWTANTVFELNVGRTEFRDLHDPEMASLNVAQRDNGTIDESLSCGSESIHITDV